MKLIILVILAALLCSCQCFLQPCYGYDLTACEKARDADSEARVVECEDKTFAVQELRFFALGRRLYTTASNCGMTLEEARARRDELIRYAYSYYEKDCNRVDIIKPEVVVK